MDIESAREYCLSLPFATEDMPFGEEDVAIRVKGHIFAFLDLMRPWLMVLKCDAAYAEELRDRYQAVEPAWHWNKKYWNQITFDSDVDDELFRSLMRHSYDEVVKKLTKREQAEVRAALSKSE